MKICLLGYMGSGKTTIAKLLANDLQVDFFDLDDWITQRENRSVRKIFKEKGELYFRRAERDSLQEILNTKSNFVLATGGGTPVFYNNLNTINQNSISIYLQASPLILSNRLWPERGNRPLIQHIQSKDTLTEFIAKHLFERQQFYNQSKITIKVKAQDSAVRIAKSLQKNIIN